VSYFIVFMERYCTSVSRTLFGLRQVVQFLLEVTVAVRFIDERTAL
jgi:hypothetical protein